MLTKEGCQARRRRLWETLPDSCDAVLIHSPEHLAYLCAYWPSPFTFRTNEAGALLVLTRDNATLIGDNLLRPFLDKAFVDALVTPLWYEGRASAPPRRNLLMRTAAAFVNDLKPSVLAVESASVPSGLIDLLREAGGIQSCHDVGPLLVGLRRNKHADEVATIEAAVRLASLAQRRVASFVRSGMSEIEVYREVERLCSSDEGEHCLVYGDFAAGRRARGPNTLPQTTPLRQGDLLILDFSVVISGYRGDIAQTLCVGGAPSDRQRAVFNACAAALQVGEALLTPGAITREIDAAVRAELQRHGFDAKSRGHMGHGVGLGHPEAPFIVPESDERLQVGDVITLEPSLFPEDLEGGVRVEHNYVITDTGFDRLSDHPLALDHAPANIA
jgi:Xaa-Pro aminopeptidase